MLCYRQDIHCAAIDTNNFVESWHNALKTHFFKDRQQRRADTVIYIMTKSVIPHYQRKWKHGLLQVGRMSANQRSTSNMRRRAQEYLESMRENGYMGKFIFGTPNRSIIKVRSFQADVFQDVKLESLVYYEIHLDFSRDDIIGEVVSCQCEAFQKTKSICKHIALVLIEKKPIKFHHSSVTWVPQDNRSVGEVDSNDHDCNSNFGLEDDVSSTATPSASAADTPESRRERKDSLVKRISSLDLDMEMLNLLSRVVDMGEERSSQDYWKRRRLRQ